MSVFTPLERSTLEAFLAPTTWAACGISVASPKAPRTATSSSAWKHGEFVPTLVERGPVQDLPFFIELLDVLHEDGLPVPYALRTAMARPCAV